MDQHRILYKEQLSADVFLMRIHAPLLAEERKAGQFLMISLDQEYGERLPLTIADADSKEGAVTIIFQRVGEGTSRLATLKVGDIIPILVGPLGRPTHIEKFGTCVCVGGGIGVAPLYPITEALKKAGNYVISIIGARQKSLVLWEEKMRAVSDELIIVTDDGSFGRKALVTEPLKEVCSREPKPNLAVAIGPAIMMKFCVEATRPMAIPTVVSLNTIMVDGTGMCGGCRVQVGKEVKFVCVDGPEFDGHLVDFDGMIKRQQAYKQHEREAMDRFHAEHECRLEGKG